MKDFASPVELMKRVLEFAVTVAPNGIIFVVWGYLTLAILSSPFGSALNADPWLYYRSYSLKRSLNESTVSNACPTLGKMPGSRENGGCD